MTVTTSHTPPYTTSLSISIAGIAQALVVSCRDARACEQTRDDQLARVLAAQDRIGRFTDFPGEEPAVEDCWGRAMWGLGATVATHTDPQRRSEALRAFERGARQRSPRSRPMAFAALGAAEVLRVRPDNVAARPLLADAVRIIGRPLGDSGWIWPDPELSYANAVVPETLIAAGSALKQSSLLADGLRLLDWLLDQPEQPAGELADACARAFEVTGDARWAPAV